MTGPDFKALATRQDLRYWEWVRLRAKALNSDGCSGPAALDQAYILACYEHDVHYRTGKTVLTGLPISQAQADELLAIRIRQMAWDALSWNPATWKNLIGFP